VLLDAQGILRDGARFEPGVARRHFVVAAPDFLATLLLPDLLSAIRSGAPGVTLEIVPSSRRGNAWMLESGELDLALGAIVDEAPGIRRKDLCTEGFLCAVRKEHPFIKGSLSLDQYARAEHAMITLGDDHRPTWADEQLAKLGKQRKVVLRIRYFMAAPLVVARTDLLITAPAMLVRYFAELVPLRVLAPPIELPTYPEEMYWHERFDDDPAHRWLRGHLKRICAGRGVGADPQRRSFR
jgi:DNA-binding transcriptional LysR family regulator